MLFVGKSYFQPHGSDWIVYHTGDMDGHRGEVREVETEPCSNTQTALAAVDEQSEFSGGLPAGNSAVIEHEYWHAKPKLLAAEAPERRGLSRRLFGRDLCSFLAIFLPPPTAARAQEDTVSHRALFLRLLAPDLCAFAAAPSLDQFRQVDHLDFRVYRVKDPVQFFAKLRDAHSFGSEKAELAREKTWLERFHEWKRDLRASIRDFFRPQLRYETRCQFHAARVQEQKLQRIPLDVTAYAQVPLLNREQLVLGWRELLPKTRDSRIPGNPRRPPPEGPVPGRGGAPGTARLHAC